MGKKVDTIPIEVYILTPDYDIKGTVHVSKYTNSNRELTDLLNDSERRFLAVTDAEIMSKNANQPPRKYNFLEVHIDSILLVHPSSQVLFKENSRSNEDIERFRALRNKLNQTRPH
ncbi:MAG: hypothetical protein PHX18_05920 [Candidatus Gastranaerophilales bacterium]|nr:hypothetical protein [Candidatus Gastranaerophilales bacterium]